MVGWWLLASTAVHPLLVAARCTRRCRSIDMILIFGDRRAGGDHFSPSSNANTKSTSWILRRFLVRVQSLLQVYRCSEASKRSRALSVDDTRRKCLNTARSYRCIVFSPR
uniref:Putative secreted protein n=1 Tax=Anopheles marajoara TaxID=58244 RepID=A0A2M4C801_9DIPT